MRPSLKEMLAGMHHTLQQVIIPELSSPHAALQARSMSRLLKYLVDSWDSLQPALEEENQRARQLLEEVSRFLEERRSGPPQGALGPAREEISAVLDSPRGHTLESLSEENLRLRGGLCRALELLELATPGGRDSSGERLKKAIHQLAKERIDRELQFARKKNE
ncbi:MAG: hypothetical protein ACE5JL_14965 [Dehalococcoidia bacterium]